MHWNACKDYSRSVNASCFWAVSNYTNIIRVYHNLMPINVKVCDCDQNQQPALQYHCKDTICRESSMARKGRVVKDRGTIDESMRGTKAMPSLRCSLLIGTTITRIICLWCILDMVIGSSSVTKFIANSCSCCKYIIIQLLSEGCKPINKLNCSRISDQPVKHFNGNLILERTDHV